MTNATWLIAALANVMLVIATWALVANIVT